MVLLTTIVALAVGLMASGRRNSELHAVNEELAANNKEYRNQLGLFEIEDPAKIHSIRVPTDPDQASKFRIYLPPGRKYFTHYQVHRIPETGVPSRQDGEELPPGEHLITIEFEQLKDSTTGKLLPHASIRVQCITGESSSTKFIGVGEDKNDWIVNKETGQPACSTHQCGDELRLSDPAKPLIIYRLRASKVDVRKRDADGKLQRWATHAIPGEVDGFMLWIESEPLPTPRPPGSSATP